MHSWANARAVAASAVRALPPERRPLTEAIGQELAIATGAAVPESTTSVLRSEDGEAVRGSGERGEVVRGPGERRPEERAAGQRRDVLNAPTTRAVIPPEGGEAGTGAEVELLPRPGSVPLVGSTASSAAATSARAVAA